MAGRSDRRADGLWAGAGSAATALVATAVVAAAVALPAPGPVEAAARAPEGVERVGTSTGLRERGGATVTATATPVPTRAPTASPTRSPTPTPTPTRSAGPADGADRTQHLPQDAVRGLDTTRVPSLVGLTVTDARAALTRAGLRTDALAGLPDSGRILSQRGTSETDLIVTVAVAEPTDEPVVGESPEPEPATIAPSRSPLDRQEIPETTASQVEELIEECDRLDREFDPAVLVMDDSVEMHLGEATRYEAALTLDVDAPSREISAVEDGRRIHLQVTCRVLAQLRGSPQDFEIDQTGWLQESLLTSRTARWSWFVTPLRNGPAPLELVIQPVITVKDTGESEEASEFRATTLRRPVSVTVTAPPDQFLAGLFDRASRLMQSVQGLLVTLTAVAVAALGLWAVLRRRQGDQADPPGGAGSDPAPPA